MPTDVKETAEIKALHGGESPELALSRVRSSAEVATVETGAHQVAEFLHNIPEQEAGFNIGGRSPSEKATESKTRKGGYVSGGSSGAGGSAGQVQISDIRSPKPRVMVRKVKTAIKYEIHQIEKQVQKYKSHPMQNAYELTKAINTLRKLKSLLRKLIYASVDYIKNLWIHVIQGKRMVELVA